jgi:WD40 repeat protein
MASDVSALTNPFPGLAPFDEPEAALFFGRDKEIEELLERLASRRLLAVIGVSGCGKSSLVRAGVKPVLRVGTAQSLPGRWRIETITPGNAPIQALRKSIQASPSWPATSFDLVEHARQILRPGENLLLIVDQLEELFSFRAATLSQDAGNEAALFVNLLLNAVDQREVPIYILLTMRTDFLGECAQFRGLPEALNDCYFLVPRLTRIQQQEAIERPLQEQGVSITPSLLQRLLNESAEDPDDLPVLQHLLRRLWENWGARGGNGPINDQDYTAVGGWKNAINREAERVLSRFPADEEKIQLVFQWITDRGTGEKPVRRPRPLAECAEVSGLGQERLREIVEGFQSRGLLKPSDGTGESLVDLPHESVMWQWTRLQSWIVQETERAAQLRFLLQSARQQVPLVGLALDSALKLRVQWKSQPALTLRYLQKTELEAVDSWVAHSERLVRAKRRRRVWILAGIATLVGMLAILAVWISIRERTLRNAAEGRELTAWSGLSLEDDPQRSLILGLYAWGKQHAMVPGLADFLHSALLRSAIRLTLHGHQDSVWSVAWSPDGSKLATASKDNTARVWDAATGRELLVLRGHLRAVESVAWSPDGSKLATASEDRAAKVWDASSGRELLTVYGHLGDVMSVAWSPDGTKLATASRDNTAKVWDAVTGRELLDLPGHQDQVLSVAWSPDGSQLATASSDKTAKVWQAETGRELLTLRGHQARVERVAWSPDGSQLATASWDRTAKTWDAGTGTELLTLRGHQDQVLSVAWSPDGHRLGTASGDRTAKVWDAKTGREMLTARGHDGPVWSLAWSPDSNKFATSGADHTAKVWEAQPRELLTLRGHQNGILGVAWSPDAGKLVTASLDKTAKVWEAATGRELLTLRNHDGAVMSAAWSPDGSKLATASWDSTAKVWEAATGHEFLTLRGHQGYVMGLAWSPDGAKLATASRDGAAKVWEAATGRELLTLRGHQGPVMSVAWSPDGSKLATAGDDTTAKVWEAATGHELTSLHGHQGPVLSVAWSPNGSMLATGSGDNSAKVWEAVTGHELLSLHGHQGYVMSVAWSPDGSRLATASWDGTEKVWDAKTGRDLLTLRGHQGQVMSVAWSPDGGRLASAADDRTVQVYVVDPALLIGLVRSRIDRNLTPDECRRYLNTDLCPALPSAP